MWFTRDQSYIFFIVERRFSRIKKEVWSVCSIFVFPLSTEGGKLWFFSCGILSLSTVLKWRSNREIKSKGRRLSQFRFGKISENAPCSFQGHYRLDFFYLFFLFYIRGSYFFFFLICSRLFTNLMVQCMVGHFNSTVCLMFDFLSCLNLRKLTVDSIIASVVKDEF